MPEDNKTTLSPTSSSEKSRVTEHPISDADTQKFAGQGDFALPVSPLDELMVQTEGVQDPSTAADSKTEPVSQPHPTMPKPETKSEQMKVEEIKTEPKKAEAVTPPVDLEKKAQDMLKELKKPVSSIHDKPEPENKGGSKPKKKRSGTASKMALAAVLVVLMGAGGVVGMNVLKLQQAGDNRTQALKTQFTCTKAQSTQGLSCNHTVDAKWVDGWCMLNLCPNGDTNNDGACSVPTDEGATVEYGECFDYILPKARSLQNNMCYQVDTTVSKTDFRWCPLSSPCVGYEDNLDTCVAQPPVERQHICTDVTPKESTLKPGESMTVKGTSSADAKAYYLAFYNPDNLSDPNEPRSSKRLLIDGQEFGLGFTPSSPGKEHTFTVNYDQIHKPDGNYNNQIPTRVAYMFYFTDMNGVVSHPETFCWGVITFGSAPTPAPTPTPTPTPPPASIACTSLQKEDKTLKVGDQLQLTCAATGTGINHYEFRYKVGTDAWVNVPATSVTNNKTTVTLSKKGSYQAECRVCKTADSTQCTTWGQSGQ